MSTSREEIKSWLERGQKEGATHVIVVCDTFDHEDYPVMVMPGEDAKEKYEEYNGKDMQRVMEVYNLKMDWDDQLKPGTRVKNFDGPHVSTRHQVNAPDRVEVNGLGITPPPESDFEGDQVSQINMLNLKPITTDLIDEVIAERIRQIKKGFNEAHDDHHSLDELADHILAYAGWGKEMLRLSHPEKFRTRMVQVATMALAAVESYDRRNTLPKETWNVMGMTDGSVKTLGEFEAIIEIWSEHAKREGASHMLITCRESDNHYEPVYVMPFESLEDMYTQIEVNGVNVVREYDLSKDIREQHPTTVVLKHLKKQPAPFKM